MNRALAVVVAVVLVLSSCRSVSSEPDAVAGPHVDRGLRGRYADVDQGLRGRHGHRRPRAPRPTRHRRLRSPTAPAWLGTRVLPLRDDGFGEVLPTPPDLVERRFDTIDLLEPPADDTFEATIREVPDDVVARSTWQQACPVGLDDLRYVTVSFWGFDDRAHTGELLVNARIANAVVEIFRQLHATRFPVEEMRIVAPYELDLEPTGDGNNTTAFICRPAVGSTSWSEHALGLAIDVNPFHNPYVKGDLVLPELASAYVDRDDVRPGMILEDDMVIGAFADAGFVWGGTWRSLKDYMHFSTSGR